MKDTKSRKLFITNYPPQLPGEEIVISGLAGRYPESDNVSELGKNLYSKKDLVTDDDRRWKKDNPDVPHRMGKVNNIEKFDALYFGIHPKLANTMDPLSRMLCEHAFEAVVDAGVNPHDLKGSNIGVFIAASHSENTQILYSDKLVANGYYGINGTSRAMFANRISYWFGLHGISCAVDAACSSSIVALESAYRAIRLGHIDGAIVGGANLCLSPGITFGFNQLGTMSPDGKCKAFDDSANGYVRAEAVTVIFLQKVKNAKRKYATLVHCKTNCDGFKEKGVTFPSAEMQGILFEECYRESNVSPLQVSYLEAHGTGTIVGDPAEVTAISEVFTKGRKTPLLIGSVKSNLGHAEPVSGLVALTKVLISMENCLLPPNIHYKKPREEIKHLLENRVKVVTEVTPWDGGYAGVNSFGFGGTNSHALLKSNPKNKVNNGVPSDDLPRLVTLSGRTEEAVEILMDNLLNKPTDAEFIRLVQDVFSKGINGHPFRGYAIVGGADSADIQKANITTYLNGETRPIVFVYSGLGSQWPGMGKSLLRLPLFAKAINKCDKVLKTLGIDIYDVLINTEHNAFANILNAFVGITAVQIGLTDVLYELGIKPDYIIGHSLGELGCSYADGALTADQTILCSYWRGKVTAEAQIIQGAMAAVGVGYHVIKDICPPEITIACHNSHDSCTISGPYDEIQSFIKELQNKDIFTREINSGNIPYHSKHVAVCASQMRKVLHEIIPQPKPRSKKWISTSVYPEKLSSPEAKLCSAEYHCNNLINPVFFEEASVALPQNAITIEIAPHALLRGILRSQMSPDCSHISLTKRGHNNSLELLLKGIGQMYNIGFHPEVAKLYPDIEFPVSRGTSMIAPLIKWDHTKDWLVYSPDSNIKCNGERHLEINVQSNDYAFMTGHIIDGRNLLPAMGYLQYVWETIALMNETHYRETSVVFEDLRFLRAVTLPKEGTVELTIMIQKGTGNFEVTENETALVTGVVRICENPTEERMDVNSIRCYKPQAEEILSSKDIYKEFRLRGYQYSGLFKGIKSATTNGERGTIKWTSNWVAFMDSLLQTILLNIDSRGLFIPVRIDKVVIDVNAHNDLLETSAEGDHQYTSYSNPYFNFVSAGGCEIKGGRVNEIFKKKIIVPPVLEEYKFVAYRDKEYVTLADGLRLALHILLENQKNFDIKTLEYLNDNEKDLLSEMIVNILADLPLVKSDVNIVSNSISDAPDNVNCLSENDLNTEFKANIAFGRNLLTEQRTLILQQLIKSTIADGYIATFETMENRYIEAAAENFGLNIIMEKMVENELLVVLSKQQKLPPTIVINTTNEHFDWINNLKEALEENKGKDSANKKNILLVAQGDFKSGLMGLVNCLRREPGGDVIHCMLIQDLKATPFSLENSLYADQLRLKLVANVLRNGNLWGSYRHLPFQAPESRMVYHGEVCQLTKGDISSLKIVEGSIYPDMTILEPQKLVHVVYSSLNFRDVMVVNGRINNTVIIENKVEDNNIGNEYSGITASGRRVMGITPCKGFTNIVVCDDTIIWDIPDGWSLEDAATVPTIYATCICALYREGKIKKGDKVLIHSGAGGIGQAAINICLHEGCEIFTTVGTPEKREFIRRNFPQISNDHIGNSRDTSFEDLIMKETEGKGVNVVLNSLAGEKLRASLRCLAPGGRFLEIGKFDLLLNNTIGLEMFAKEISYHGVMLDRLFVADKSKRHQITELFKSYLEKGIIKPITRTVFDRNEVEEAFRYMAAGKHIGKILLKMSDEKSLNHPILAIPRYYCRKDRSYLVMGGLGGVGLELIEWLIHRGAQNIVITSRTGLRTGYQKKRLETWKKYKCNILIVSGKDTSVEEDCKYILQTANDLAPLDGIFNLAVILRDSVFENQTEQTFKISFKSKAWSTEVVDKLSRKMCPMLRHFVVFSSMSCGRGNAGQTNYGMSNSIMERICEQRVADGYPALAIQWGAIGDVGLVAEMQDEHKELVISGSLQQSIASCLHVLNDFLTSTCTIVGSMVVAEKSDRLIGERSLSEAVADILGIKDITTLSKTTRLSELGADSMMVIEIKQTLEREFEILLTDQEIMKLNFGKLANMTYTKAVKQKQDSLDADEDLQAMQIISMTIGHDHINEDIIVELPTLMSRDDEQVYMIPGLEGLYNIFMNIAPKIKCSAVCIQPHIAINDNNLSIKLMAEKAYSELLEKNKIGRKFVIVAHSFGSLIAIELARILEERGLIGRLILVDGAPTFLKECLVKMSVRKDKDLENILLTSVMNVIGQDCKQELSKKLECCKSWEEKVDAFLAIISNKKLTLTKDEMKQLLHAMYIRYASINNYNCTTLLKSPIILIKPSQMLIKSPDEDYNLSKVTRNVTTYVAEGNHLSILNNKIVVKAINGDLRNIYI